MGKEQIDSLTTSGRPRWSIAMKRNTLILVTLVSVTLVTLSCKDNAVPVGSRGNADAIIPLAIGNQWVTQMNGWDSTGRPQVQLIDSIRIGRDTIIQLERWYVWNAGTYVTNRPTGFWTLESSLPELFLKFPASLNDWYVFRGDTVQVTATDTIITVSGGTFHCVCYHVRYEWPDIVRQVLYASPNTGEIRRETFARTSGGREYLASRADLVSFRLQ
jgi:hypothetical protein